MRNTIILSVLGALGVAAWVALVVLVNAVSPDTLTQVLFLGLFFAGLSLTATPVGYLVSTRWSAYLGRRGNLQRALRQGMLVGALGTALMALRFMRVLTPLVAITLTLATAVFEAMMQLRTR